MQQEINLDFLGRTTDITVEEVKSLETFKEWNESQVLELIVTLKTLSTVLYNNWSEKSKFGKEIVLSNDNQINIKEAA